MPLDVGNTDEVLRVREEISAHSPNANITNLHANFSKWKIYKGRNSAKYRLKYTNSKDDECAGGYYLANLILQGGGTLGLAHAGFITGLELAGYRFPAIAGTSAGAIVAVGAFGLRGNDITNTVGDELTELVSDVPMDTFVDGPRNIRRLIKRIVAGRSYAKPLYWDGLISAAYRLLTARGLNSGLAFELWMNGKLSEYKLDTTGRLFDLMAQITQDLIDSDVENASKEKNSPKAANEGRANNQFQNPFANCKTFTPKKPDILKMIAMAMPTGTKFSLPHDLYLLDEEYLQISPARLVRMSMSIPLFFEPCVMQTNRKTWPDFVAKNMSPFVSDRDAWEMEELRRLTFLDGGLFSNLPTDEIVESMPEEIATISVPLVSSKSTISITNRNSVRALISDSAAVLNAVRLQRDRDAHRRMTKNPQHENKKLIKIDTGLANWLNFTMSDTEKEELYLAGLKRARDFILTGV